MAAERLAAGERRRARRRWRPRSARSSRPAGSVTEAVARDRRGGARRAATRRCASTSSASTRSRARPLRVAPEELDAAVAGLDPAVRAGPGGRDRQRRRRGRAPAWATTPRSQLPQGHRVLLREVPGRAAPRSTSPGGRNPYPSTVVMGVVTARAAGVDEVVVCAPGAHPVILAAAALCGADEVLRMGGAQADRRAGLRHADDPPRRRHRRARAASTCRRPSAWWPPTPGSTASTAPATCSCWPRPARAATSSPPTSWPRPSTARARSSAR